MLFAGVKGYDRLWGVGEEVPQGCCSRFSWEDNGAKCKLKLF